MSPALSIADNMFLGRELRKPGILGNGSACSTAGDGEIRARQADRARPDDDPEHQPGGGDAVRRPAPKRVYYLSLEFLIGRLMRDAMSNIGMMEPVREALKRLNVDLGDLINLEPDAALGNGGLGRLAACFMESMATVQIPAYGYGIRYVNGMFRQEMSEGWQVELPEDWLAHGNPVGVRAARERSTRSASAARRAGARARWLDAARMAAGRARAGGGL
jgi:glucan phosphorylase